MVRRRGKGFVMGGVPVHIIKRDGSVADSLDEFIDTMAVDPAFTADLEAILEGPPTRLEAELRAMSRSVWGPGGCVRGA